MANGDLVEPTPGELTAAGDPVPVLVEFVPPEPIAGDITEDSAARPPLGAGAGPRLPTGAELMRANYELGLDPLYSDTGGTT